MLIGDRRGALSAERGPTGEQLEEDDAGRVEVGASVDGLAACLLGREILGGAEHGTGLGDRRGVVRDGARDAEVHHLDLAGLGDHDVARLDVAVHEERPVAVFQCREYLRDDAHGFGLLDRAVGDDVLEEPSVDELHHDVGDLLLIAQLVDRGLLARVEDPDDGRMRHPGGLLGLLAEHQAEPRVGRE